MRSTGAIELAREVAAAHGAPTLAAADHIVVSLAMVGMMWSMGGHRGHAPGGKEES